LNHLLQLLLVLPVAANAMHAGFKCMQLWQPFFAAPVSWPLVNWAQCCSGACT
jgi:hypothetical protein